MKREREEEDLPVETTLLVKVISGGNTGADLAGLRAAKALGLETGGTSLPENTTSTEINRRHFAELAALGLVTPPLTTSFSQACVLRSMKNVDDSGATVAFRTRASAGTDKTIGYAMMKEWQVRPLKNTDHFEVFDAAHMYGVYRPIIVIHEMSAQAGEAL